MLILLESYEYVSQLCIHILQIIQMLCLWSEKRGLNYKFTFLKADFNYKEKTCAFNINTIEKWNYERTFGFESKMLSHHLFIFITEIPGFVYHRHFHLHFVIRDGWYKFTLILLNFIWYTARAGYSSKCTHKNISFLIKKTASGTFS